jgi:putative Mg2+ transporter-C (MgtC) family protein
MSFPLDEILSRLLAATLLGTILGIDRDLHKKPAGLRVLAMVSLGSALIVVCCVASLAADEQKATEGALRVVQGIIGGIGFLGAGVILRSERANEVHGLTTAAAIWVAAGLGVGCGLGQWKTAAIGLTIALLVLWIGRPIERTQD